MAETYRVPKHEIPAKVCMPGKEPMGLKLFLSEFAETHEGIERPSDLLNGSSTFLPVAGDDGEMMFLNRDVLMAVRVRSEDEFSGDGLLAVALASEDAVSTEVDVVMEDGSRFRGVLSYLMPEGRRRLQDYLNHSDRFLIVREGDDAVLLNKERIVQITAR